MKSEKMEMAKGQKAYSRPIIYKNLIQLNKIKKKQSIWQKMLTKLKRYCMGYKYILTKDEKTGNI